MSELITRREMIKTAGLVAAGLTLGGHVSPAQAAPQASPAGRRRAIRVAHLTDIHVQPERKAQEGMIACLHHVQGLSDRPELILTGGDAIMDSFEADDARTQTQWDIWNGALRSDCSTPVRHCIGNHDIWGWNKAKSKTRGDEPSYGKKRAVENLGIPERFHSFDQSGWHFVILDSTQPDGDGYKAYLDEEQFDWLTRDLAAIPVATPVLVVSHIPIISVTAIVSAKDQKREEWTINGSVMHLDAVRLRSLFARHRNVKLCVSGHMHLLDRADYDGVSYLCNGAVSGAWWKGKHRECSEGYAVLDLYDDGTFDRQYITYGWQAAPQ